MYSNWKIDNNDEYLYLQITNIIAHDIESGRLKPNTRLPSQRKLCEIFNVSRNTIIMAIEELVYLSYVEVRAQSGVYVKTRRIEQLERGQEMLTHIATSVEVLVSEQRHLREELENLTGKVDVLEQKPGQRWETVVDKVLLMAVGALVGFVLVQLGFQA